MYSVRPPICVPLNLPTAEARRVRPTGSRVESIGPLLSYEVKTGTSRAHPQFLRCALFHFQSVTRRPRVATSEGRIFEVNLEIAQLLFQ